MTTLLSQLLRELNNSSFDTTDSALPTLPGIYQCRRPQQLRQVPIHQPMVMLGVSGHKEVSDGDCHWSIQPGELFITPGNRSYRFSNHPDEKQSHYIGLRFGFENKVINQFKQFHSEWLGSISLSPRWTAPAPEEIQMLFQQWLDWDKRFEMDEQLLQHRQIELMLLLARAGLASNILHGNEPGWRQRVVESLSTDPAREWRIRDVCQHLHTSESSLRRRLQDEDASFRDLLEEVRLARGLMLLQETRWPVSRIAETVGYQSQSRFGERFKRRFGLTPTELRQTRSADSGESLAFFGE